MDTEAKATSAAQESKVLRHTIIGLAGGTGFEIARRIRSIVTPDMHFHAGARITHFLVTSAFVGIASAALHGLKEKLWNRPVSAASTDTPNYNDTLATLQANAEEAGKTNWAADYKNEQAAAPGIRRA